MQDLTPEENKLIIESLLFAGSVQVFSEHTDQQSKQMIELAKKLNKTVDADLNSIYFLEEKQYEEIYATDILDSFPKVPRVGIADLMGQ